MERELAWKPQFLASNARISPVVAAPHDHEVGVTVQHLPARRIILLLAKRRPTEIKGQAKVMILGVRLPAVLRLTREEGEGEG